MPDPKSRRRPTKSKETSELPTEAEVAQHYGELIALAETGDLETCEWLLRHACNKFRHGRPCPSYLAKWAAMIVQKMIDEGAVSLALKGPRKKGRPTGYSLATLKKRAKILRLAWEAKRKGASYTQTVRQVAEECHVSERHVQRELSLLGIVEATKSPRSSPTKK